MSTVEILITAWAVVSMITSLIALYFTGKWKFLVEKKYSAMDALNVRTNQALDDMTTGLLSVKADLHNLKTKYLSSGIDILKIRSEDHEKSIDSIRRDLLDLQVISGTLPSKAGTMLQEVENTQETLRAVQRSYLETRAIVDTTKEQVEKLAEAYASLHFTSAELEAMEEGLAEMVTEWHTAKEKMDKLAEMLQEDDMHG